MGDNLVKFASKNLFRIPVFIILPILFILFSATLSACNTTESVKTINNASTVEVPETIEVKESEPEEVIIVIDAGHGGNDWGTHFGSIREKNLNLDIALKLGDILQKKDLRIAYTREKDVFISLGERAELANSINATLFISIHNNKMPGNPNYKGTETLYSAAANSRFDKMSDKRLAQIVQDALVQELKTSDKGIIYRPELAVLRRTTMPAVIAEIGYLSNSSDREKLSTSSFRQRAAEALSNAVLKALDEMGASKTSEGKWVVMGK